MRDTFRRFANQVSEWMGTPWAFTTALLVVISWGATGPHYHFSDTWQIVINTGTTIVTFLMVFILQTTQNRDARALHLKLDELIRTQQMARNKFANLEDASEATLKTLKQEFAKLEDKTPSGGPLSLPRDEHADSPDTRPKKPR